MNENMISLTDAELEWLKACVERPHLLDCAKSKGSGIAPDCTAKHMIWWDSSVDISDADLATIDSLRGKLGLGGPPSGA